MTALLTPVEAAQSIHPTFPASKIVAAYRAGELVGTKFGRTVLYDPADVTAWITAHKTPRAQSGGPTSRGRAQRRNRSAA